MMVTGYSNVVAPVSSVVSHGYAAPAHAGTFVCFLWKLCVFFCFAPLQRTEKWESAVKKISICFRIWCIKSSFTRCLRRIWLWSWIGSWIRKWIWIGYDINMNIAWNQQFLHPKQWYFPFSWQIFRIGYTTKVVAPVAAAPVLSHGIAAAPALGSYNKFEHIFKV